MTSPFFTRQPEGHDTFSHSRASSARPDLVDDPPISGSQPVVGSANKGNFMSTSPRGRLLIVDDEPELLKALGETAAAHGYDVTSRGSGAEALALLRETSFDL